MKTIKTLNDFQIAALRTAPEIQISDVLANGSLRSVRDLRHGADGLCTETGEIVDVLKKHEQYGKPIDWVNIKEEIGDALWYIAILCRAAGVSLEEVANLNISKLRVRYPEKFCNDRAVNRDTEAERQVLEGKAAP